MKSLTGLLILSCFYSCEVPKHPEYIVENHGAIIRMDTAVKNIYLVFTGHEFGDGIPVIHEVLSRFGIKASFFFTGDFYRNPEFSEWITLLVKEGHYLGAHSDKHLLYCSWEKRDSLLVTREQFLNDLDDIYNEMKKFGIEKNEAIFFMPPYEWYNSKIAEWTKEAGFTLMNFTPGTSSNQDWTYPEPGGSYVSSDTIFNRILAYEEKSGMNGFILLTHIGADLRRPDPFYFHLDSLITVLQKRGYSFKKFGS